MYPILKAEKLADKIYLMVVEAPRVARACEPGEFVIVKMVSGILTVRQERSRSYSRPWELLPRR